MKGIGLWDFYYIGYCNKNAEYDVCIGIQNLLIEVMMEFDWNIVHLVICMKVVGMFSFNCIP